MVFWSNCPSVSLLLIKEEEEEEEEEDDDNNDDDEEDISPFSTRTHFYYMFWA